MKQVLIILFFSSILELCAGVTVTCYMEPNRVLPSNVKSKVTGTVTLSQKNPEAPTSITVSLKGTTRYTVHGFHVHKYGDIFTNGCQSCGSHFNPYATLHGGPRGKNRHVGDLGNLMSNRNGKIETEFIDYFVTLHGDNSVVGRSLVLHAKVDDFGRGTGPAREESLKTGNAGARLACCTIVHAPAPSTPSN